MRGTVPRALSVMTYNIRQGRDAEGRLDLAGTAAVIRAQQPDLVALQEVGRHWSADSDGADQPAELERLLEMPCVFAPNLDRAPTRPGGPRRQYGIAILSAWPVLACEHILLPRASTDNEQRGLLVLDADVDGRPFRVHNTHLGVSADDRRLQVEAIVAALGGAEAAQALVGDLNAPPAAPELRPLFERLRDAWSLAGQGDGFTFPASAPSARIDYVLVSPQVRVSAARVPAVPASDHLPLVAGLAPR
jgi:endonuclease/exonuclease/phosphatase family metal-dependent hydrolase